MTKTIDLSYKEAAQPSKSKLVLSDLKLLFKGPVLIANVLPVLVGFWLALTEIGRSFQEVHLLFWLTMSGSTLLMGGALVLNNWYDADIDSVMKRTQQRPTVTGSMSLKFVLFFGLILSGLGQVLLFFTTIEAAVYGFIGWFTYVVLYTMWSKRKYTLNTVIGSLSGAVTPMIGWGALTSTYHIVPIILFLILFIWQMPHTFAIAIRKFEEYRAADVAMLPVVRGIEITKRQTFVYVLCLVPLPFYLISIGPIFVAFATLLNMGYLLLAVRGFWMEDVKKWADQMFLYSVSYIALLFILMIVFTL